MSIILEIENENLY